jgi:hypothetical protein
MQLVVEDHRGISLIDVTALAEQDLMDMKHTNSLQMIGQDVVGQHHTRKTLVQKYFIHPILFLTRVGMVEIFGQM